MVNKNTMELIDLLEKIHNDCDNVPNYKEFSEVDQFNEIAAKFASDVSKVLLIITSIQNNIKFPHGYTRDQAPIVGLMLKIAKDYKYLCNAFIENDSEISSIFYRSSIEAGANLIYLIKSDENTRTQFRRASYRSRIGALKEMDTAKIHDKMLGAKERLKQSILEKIKKDGFDLDELLSLKSSDWKINGLSFRDILTKVGYGDKYSLTYGIYSDKIHGNWQELIEHHLKEKDGYFFPDLSKHPVDPRFISPISNLCLNCLVEYLIWTEINQGALFMLISDLKNYNLKLMEEFKTFYHAKLKGN
ncbi:MAG TPA: DUF5677 domain-containing protein [Candidatus Wujingus californicus]|uniref:DUF5677 domain-containing protein n=2 Tax=Candidatus Wujingus californicus TaxID=3367618 RepID=UPI001DA6B684|nr:hypothetical protein [Planctomycetota bacterium]MDO8131545.1 DUF5677 domain-containing protein [Candidatus Brocadiales bacterium]